MAKSVGIKMGVVLAGVLGLGLGAVGTAVSGSSGFRCPTTGRLISVGQSPYEVRNKCREPDDLRTTVEQRTVREKVRRWEDGVAGEVTVERTVEVPIEEWTFDFGRHRFIELLRFESNRLISVVEGGRGLGDSE
jgi:Protein of unknown function (DUF2845)